MYGKFYESAFTGSMAGAGANKFAVWGYIISHTKADGLVELNTKLMAAPLGMAEEEIQAVIDWLCQPDPKSRSKEKEGRRLIKLSDYLYEVVNSKKYAGIANENERRSYMRSYMRGYRKGVASPGFDKFWQAYPRKAGKGAAEKAFQKIDVPLNILIAAIEKQKQTDQWMKDEGLFIPYPATWLNQKRWEDDTKIIVSEKPPTNPPVTNSEGLTPREKYIQEMENKNENKT